jgi:hypothetical protein
MMEKNINCSTNERSIGSELKVSNDHPFDPELEDGGDTMWWIRDVHKMCKSCHLKKILFEKYLKHLNCLGTIGNELKWNGV